MNKNLALSVAAAIALSFLAITGCKKFVHQNIKAASNSSLAFLTYDDVFTETNKAVSSEMALDEMVNASWNLQGSVCATVTLEPIGTSFPKTLTIDYGTECIGPDGVVRSGKIIAVFDGNFRTEGTSINVSFENFASGQYAVAGKDSIYNNGTDGDGNPIFNEMITEAVISWGTQEVLWQAELNRTWLEGDTTNFTTASDTMGGTFGMDGLNDDLFSIIGSASGNDSNTHPFSLEITQSLVLPTACEYISDGILTISPTNFNDGTVDYGAGECDKQATIEVDGEVFNFTM
ncbi:hypothetical protein OAE48_03725 [Flavobacteriales bacterium]|nr:hypothetical protein [Flavobacteriales bacterium]